MSEQQNTESQTLDPNEMSPEQRDQEEKSMLRARLKTMGKNPSPNASVETLRQQLTDAMEGKADEGSKATPDKVPGSAPVSGKQLSLHEYLRKKSHKLRRVRITCHNPNKRELPGEFISVGNNFMGVIKRYVPFGEQTDGGWHIEQAIYDVLKARQYVDIRTKTDRRTGAITVTTRLAQEFGIEDLPDLSPLELKQLGTAQVAAGTSDVG